MLILVTALTAFIAVVLVIFILNFVRFTGSYQEQRTAIEAAAIAAAKDLSQIVVEDQYFGFVSLADSAPNGRSTKAGDNYYMPVTGINTLLATVRADMIIAADLLNDQTIKQCAKLDYDRAMLARQHLVNVLEASIQPGAFGIDKDGNKVFPNDDAIAAYNSNQVRLTGGGTSLVPGSLRLTLGCVSGLTTNTRIPYPTKYADIQRDQQDNLYYKSYINIPYRDKPFVFAATADHITLVDYKKFQTSIAGLPYITPSIVKCEADEQFAGNQAGSPGSTGTRTVHASACSQPASLVDKRPNPGAFVMSFPNGAVKGYNIFQDLFSNSHLNKSPADYTLSPTNGDFPNTPLSDFSPAPINNNHAPFGQLLRLALYDWIRRGGARVDIQSIQDIFKQALDASPTSHADYFEFKNDGTATHSVVAPAPGLLPVSNNQWIAVSGLAHTYTDSSNNTRFFDVFARDYVYQSGRTQGGIHGGEPLGQVMPPRVPSTTNPVPSNTIGLNPLKVGTFQTGPAGGAIRPTYQTSGVAVEIRLSEESRQ